MKQTVEALRAVDWPRWGVLRQNSTIVLAVVALVVLLVLLSELLGSALLDWLI